MANKTAISTKKIPTNLANAAQTKFKSGNSGGYKSAYSRSIANLTNNIVNRKAFTYDPATDQAYQALSKQYGALGTAARKDTMADVAGNTGGIVSSWAVTAGQQAQNDYNQKLVGEIPSLMDAAYNRYANEISMDTSALSTLQGLDDSAYNRFADNRDYTYQQGRDKVSDNQWNKQFGYQKSRDKVSDKQWQKNFDLDLDQWNYSKKKK